MERGTGAQKKDLRCSQSRGMLYAHRGLHRSSRDENTLDAFRAALDHPDYVGFECDVNISSDNIPVIIHDHTLRRTHGRGTRVRGAAAAALAGAGVAALTDVLLAAAAAGARVLLDLKDRPAALLRRLRRCAAPRAWRRRA